MKRQIALVGGQLIPIYLGIEERKPDFVHLFCTGDSKSKVNVLNVLFKSIKFHIHEVDPFEFQEIYSLVESLVFEYGNDQWELNLTGGTKVMTLAAHNIFKDLKLESFYIDQKNRIYSFTSNEYVSIKSKFKIATFLKLSGHTRIRNKNLSSYSKSDFDVANKIHLLHLKKGLDNLYRKISFDLSQKDNITSYSKKIAGIGSVNWKNGMLQILTPKFKERIDHPNALQICFTGLWWELLVASTVRSWNLKHEMMIGVELLSNANKNFAKNEIDIVLNTGQNVIFIECKSGIVKQEDLNKMRAIMKAYGGISCRSILVCRKLPRIDLLEKCKDLNIEIFALLGNSKSKKNGSFTNISSLPQLNYKLTKLVEQMQL